MPTRSTPVRSALARAGALLGVAPPAPELAVIVGHPVPYRVALPVRARMEEDAGMLVARTGSLVVAALARDMLEGEGEPHPALAAGPRRTLTNMIMGSDALLSALLEEEFRSRELAPESVVRGTGLLGRQRAVCLHGRVDEHGAGGWMEIYGTVKDGILYVLAFRGPGANPERYRAMLARVRDSFVLAG